MIAQTSSAIAEGPHVHEKWAGRAIFGGDSSYVADPIRAIDFLCENAPTPHKREMGAFIASRLSGYVLHQVKRRIQERLKPIELSSRSCDGP